MLEINANAKINLTLDILGLREDGYHEVAMVMQEIDLHDELILETMKEGIELEVLGEGLPADESNLAYKAAKIFFDELKIKGGIRLRLKKNIPMAAGLAGGSSDAAAVLKGLNTLYDAKLSPSKLCRLGAKIGSDIPFCIMGGTMLSTGRGEILRELAPLPQTYVVLAKPPLDISTPWAYKAYDKAPAAFHPDSAAMERALLAKDLPGVCALLANVLEPTVAREHPVIETYRQKMLSFGALASRMSGSGPTVYGLAKNEAAAQDIAAKLKSEPDAQVFVCKTV